MQVSENADTFLQDFGVQVTWGSVSALGILEMPDQVVGEYAISTEYAVIVEHSKFDGAEHGDTITVEGSDYKIREYRKVDDGVFARITLSKQ